MAACWLWWIMDWSTFSQILAALKVQVFPKLIHERLFFLKSVLNVIYWCTVRRQRSDLFSLFLVLSAEKKKKKKDLSFSEEFTARSNTELWHVHH